jgi:PiT family inorganic phosphate transporter
MFGNVFHEGTRGEVLVVLGSAISAAILWGGICYLRALPTSNSHALFAGLTGASWAAWGSTHLINSTLIRVFLILILTPMAALLVGAGLTFILRWLGEWLTPKAVPLADNLHVLSSMLVASADGSNDGQLAISVAMLAWGLMERIGSNTQGPVVIVPLWIKVTVGCFIALGVLWGGRRMIKKLGMSFYRLEIVQGLGAQITTACVMLGCVTSGFPVSTSQVMTGSILGAGVAKNPRDVRWLLARDIVLSWFVTVPAVALLAFAFLKFIMLVGKK